MKILVVGGTRFLGRAIVDQALAAGHDITLFNRGRTNPALFPELRRIVGDRDGDLSALSGAVFDAVIDPSAYYPRQIRSLVDALGEIGHYTFVSSISVYADHRRPLSDESATLETVDDPSVEELGAKYGGFKALCEQQLEDALPGRAHHVRAGLIVGPHDNTGRFTYWVRRLAEGGDVLAPGPPDQPVQFIDVRDLAAWIVDAAERRVTGPINATSPPGQMTMGSMLDAIDATLGGGATLEWVDETFLVERDVEPWSDLPLWLPADSMPTHAGFSLHNTDRAQALGLTTRPFAATVQATAADRDRPGDTPGAVDDYGNRIQPAGISREREAELLREWRAASPN